MTKVAKQEPTITKTHQFIINKLKENGYNKYDGGIQLFTNQFKNDFSVSINYMGTGLKIHGSEIDIHELIDDNLIRVCKTYECVL